MAQGRAAHRLALGAARGMALFIGGFSLLNLLGELRSAGFDANHWWIDLSPLPDRASQAVLAALGTALVAFAISPAARPWRRWGTAILSLAAAMMALLNAARFYQLRLERVIHRSAYLPLSFLIASALMAIAWAALRRAEWKRTRLSMVATFIICLAGFPLAQMVCFGMTDYRRPADVIVVFGAKVYPDGLLGAVQDRVLLACELYKAGLARKIIMSGGPGEPEAMRKLAVQWGVKDEDILQDDNGLNTDLTVRNTVPMFQSLSATRVLAVSHFYHLPRVKMTYERAGWEVYTVPVPHPLLGLPKFMTREVAALWMYYLRPLAR